MLSVHGDPLGILGAPDTGGQCLYIKEISKELIGLGVSQVDSFTRLWGKKPRIENIDGLRNCRVIRIPCATSEFIPKEKLKPHLFEFYENMKIFMVNQNIKYDLCHSHYWDGGLVGTWMAQGFNIPQVHTSHSLGLIKKKTTAERANLDYIQRIEDEKKIYSLASAIIAESTQEKRDLQNYYETSEDKIHIIFAGVDINWFYPRGTREEAKYKLGFNDEILILSLGRLDPRKGFDLFIQGIPHLMDSLKPLKKKLNVIISAGNKSEDGKLALSDSEKHEFDRLMKLSSKLRVDDVLRIIPRVDYDEVPLWYTASDVFVVPSRYETFGLVIVEAMACRTPVVATNIGGPPDIISEGKNGYTENPNNTNEFVLKINDIITNPEIHQKMSENAEKTATDKFSWTKIADQIKNLYSYVLGEPL